MARHFKGTGIVLRFIEYMDVGATNGWRLDDVVPAAEIVSLISAELPLEPAEENYRGEVARRWRYADGSGEIGVRQELIVAVEHVLGHAVDAAEVAAVGDRHAQVAQRSSEAVEEARRGHGPIVRRTHDSVIRPT